MFHLLGSFVARRWWAVLLVWLVVGVMVHRAAPRWRQVSRDDDLTFMPANYPSVQGQKMLDRGFPQASSGSSIVFAVERSAGPLSAADFAWVDTLAKRIARLARRDGIRVREVQTARTRQVGGSVEPNPLAGNRLVSRDRRATLITVGLDTPFLAVQTLKAVRAIQAGLEQIRRSGEVPKGLTVAMTGSATVGGNLLDAQDKSIRRSTWVTILLVIAILLLVYRSPLLALVPLVTIGVSVVLSLDVMALLTQVPGLHFQVISITPVFVVVILFGAGTDYCLFLIARYGEDLGHGERPAAAVGHSIGSVGGALAASAGTVVCGLGMMFFAQFAKIKFTGPAVAISLVVALLASLTLAPALLRLLGRLLFWPFRAPRSHPGVAEGNQVSRFWDRLSHLLARRPGAIWLGTVLAMLPLAVIGLTIRPSYDIMADLPRSAESLQGAAIIARHFSVGELGPTIVLIEDPHRDFRTPADQGRIAALSAELAALPGVTEVRSISRPVGDPELSYATVHAASSLLGHLFSRGKSAPGGGAERILQHYVSLVPPVAGTITRLDVVFAVNPFSPQGLAMLDRIEQTVAAATARGGPLAGARVGLTGPTPNTSDLRRVVTADQRRINPLVTLGVFAILLVLLRRPLVCVYLVLTVLFSYLATLGVTQLFLHGASGLDWKVQFFLFVILIAVGEDYNIFLMSRVIEEEKRHGRFEGTRLAMARTGGIITSCGLIMAGTFASLMAGNLWAFVQLGFALAFGVLLDTFVVRPVLVPALLLWWYRWLERHGAARQPAAREQAQALAQRSAE